MRHQRCHSVAQAVVALSRSQLPHRHVRPLRLGEIQIQIHRQAQQYTAAENHGKSLHQRHRRVWLLRQRSQPPTCAVVHCNRYADSSHSRQSPDPYAMRSPDNSQCRQRHQPPDDHSVVDAPCPRAALIRLLVRLVRHCAFCRVLICPNMFSCVFLRAPNLPGTMTCKFTHFFPPVQQPRKCRFRRSRRHSFPAPSKILTNVLSSKKSCFFFKKIPISPFTFFLLSVYTHRRRPKSRRQKQQETKINNQLKTIQIWEKN